jgi:hypothetical protein
VVLPDPAFNAAATNELGNQPASMLSVTVTTSWSSGGKVRRFTTHTRIAAGDQAAPVVTLQGRLTAVRATGGLPGERELTVDVGTVSLDGSQSSSVSASGSATGAMAAIGSGARADGAQDTVAAPPDTARPPTSLGTKTLSDGGQLLAQLSTTRVTDLSATVTPSLPSVGTAAAPIKATAFGSGFGSLVMSSDNLADRGGLRRLTSSPLLRHDAPLCGASCEAVTGQGWGRTTGGSAHGVTTSLTATTSGTFQLLPTDFAGEGLVQVRFASASLTCESSAAASPRARASASFAGRLRYWRAPVGGGTPGYSPWIDLGLTSSTPLAAPDPLASVSIATTVVYRHSDGTLRLLSDYLQSWASVTPATLGQSTSVSPDGATSAITLPGFLTIATVPLRADAASTFGLAFGAASCTTGTCDDPRSTSRRPRSVVGGNARRELAVDHRDDHRLGRGAVHRIGGRRRPGTRST